MKYISTRETSKTPFTVSAAEAIKMGLAPDGGLFMPMEIPVLSEEDFIRLATLPYPVRASEILSLFLTDYNKADLEADCTEAYSEEKFEGGAAQVRKISDTLYSLELWHGPTCAFKDMALQIMPRLLSRALTLTGEKKQAHILVATSGDTGKAALEGYRDVDKIKITVFYPVDGVSTMQKIQMVTQQGDNVNVCAVEGNFDDAQTGVKKIFADEKLAEAAKERGFFFSSANSINWGRLAPQIVYYISAYLDLVNSGDIELGELINIAVPTGNFGNIFAAYIAMIMGLPVNRFICASNSNCVLTDFINTGVYDRRRDFHKTMSPSMDILISSNLERLIFLLGGSAVTSALMNELSQSGYYSIPDNLKKKLQSVMSGHYCTEDETKEIIGRYFKEYGYLPDTHTAVGLGSVEKYIAETGDSHKTIVASTASPYKFALDVCSALGAAPYGTSPEEILACLEQASGTRAPAPLKKSLCLPHRFAKCVKPSEMADFIMKQ